MEDVVPEAKEIRTQIYRIKTGNNEEQDWGFFFLEFSHNTGL